MTKEEIKQLAISIYGKERVDLVEKEDNYELLIFFPFIEISNSLNYKHQIKDLYVKIIVTETSSTIFKSYIEIKGMRTTVSDLEFINKYGHSHLPRGYYAFGNFCLGSSDIATLKETMKLEMSEDSWSLFFYALPNYLNWESLEGGPYITIQNLSYIRNYNYETIIQALKSNIINIPLTCFEWENGLKVNNNSPYLLNFYNEYLSSIFQYDEETIDEIINGANKDTMLTFKEEKIHFKVEKIPYTPSLLSTEITDKITECLNKIVKKFNKDYAHNFFKSKNYSKVHGESIFKQQTNVDIVTEIAESNCVSPL